MSKRALSSLDRFSDPLTPMNYGGPPTNVPMLCKRLGVRGKPFDEKKKAVRDWLGSNEPTPFMMHQLQRDGYLD